MLHMLKQLFRLNNSFGRMWVALKRAFGLVWCLALKSAFGLVCCLYHPVLPWNTACGGVDPVLDEVAIHFALSIVAIVA